MDTTLSAAEPSAKRSLFVIALPRSLSSVVFHAIKDAVGLQEPTWTSDGEILNMDRFVMQPPNRNGDTGRKFTSCQEPEFERALDFLSQVVAPNGYAYKDVVQPFIVGEWIKRNQFPAVRIKRRVPDVAYSMLNQKWHYPARLVSNATVLELALVHGLILADRALDHVPAQIIDFDEMIFDENALQRVLTTFYGGGLSDMKYIDETFLQTRQEILERRKSELYLTLSDYVVQAS